MTQMVLPQTVRPHHICMDSSFHQLRKDVINRNVFIAAIIEAVQPSRPNYPQSPRAAAQPSPERLAEVQKYWVA